MSRDRKRLAVGNYFATREAAESVQECFMSILRMRHNAEAEGRNNCKDDPGRGRKKR